MEDPEKSCTFNIPIRSYKFTIPIRLHIMIKWDIDKSRMDKHKQLTMIDWFRCKWHRTSTCINIYSLIDLLIDWFAGDTGFNMHKHWCIDLFDYFFDCVASDLHIHIDWLIYWLIVLLVTQNLHNHWLNIFRWPRTSWRSTD